MNARISAASFLVIGFLGCQKGETPKSEQAPVRPVVTRPELPEPVTPREETRPRRDFAQWDLIGTLRWNGTHLTKAEFTPDGKTIVTCGIGAGEGEARILGLPNLIAKGVFRDPRNEFTSIAFSRDGNVLALGAGKLARIFDFKSGQERVALDTDGDISEMLFHPTERLLITIGGYVSFWNYETGEKLPDFYERSGNHGALSRDGETLEIDGSLWSMKNRKQFAQLRSKGGPASFSEDGIAIALSDGIWDARPVVNDGRPRVTFGGHEGYPTGVEFTVGNEYVMTAGYDGMVKAWTSNSGELVANFRAHNRVNGMDLSSDGELMVTAGEDGDIKLWKAAVLVVNPN